MSQVQTIPQGAKFTINQFSDIINQTGVITESTILVYGGYNKYVKGYSFYTEDCQVQGNLKKDAIVNLITL